MRRLSGFRTLEVVMSELILNIDLNLAPFKIQHAVRGELAER